MTGSHGTRHKSLLNKQSPKLDIGLAICNINWTFRYIMPFMKPVIVRKIYRHKTQSTERIEEEEETDR